MTHMHFRKSVVIIVTLALILNMLTLGTFAVNGGNWTDPGNYAASFSSGTGTEEDPYIIESSAELALLSKNISVYRTSYFKVADGVSTIDLSAYEWTPISPSDATIFTGSFDGNGVTITGLNIGTEITPAAIQYAGLFGMIGRGAVVRDVKLDDVNSYTAYSTTEGMVGGIAAVNLGGIVSGCSVSGVISAEADTNRLSVGGIVGRNTQGTMSDRTYSGLVINCENNTDITVVSGTGVLYAGGVVGYQYNTAANYRAAVINCRNAGSITGNSQNTSSAFGGIAGYVPAWGGITEIANCLNTGSVSSTGTANAGSMAGSIGAITSSHLYWKEGTSSKVFGAGMATADQIDSVYLGSAQFIDVLNQNAYDYEGLPAGFYLYAWEEGQDGCPVISNIPIYSVTLGNWADYAAASFSDITHSGASRNDAIEIVSAGELALLAKDISVYKTKHFKIADGIESIDLSAHEWIPIGISDAARFDGSFDGNGATITGLKIGDSSERAVYQYAGLFGIMGQGAVVKNVNLTGAAIYVGYYVASVPGYVGGIAGLNQGGIINGCTVSGVVDARADANYTNVGGILGRNTFLVTGSGTKYSGLVINCQNYAAVTGTAQSGTTYAGGVAGSQQSTDTDCCVTVINCSNAGAVSGSGGNTASAFGGIVGYLPAWGGPTVTRNCYNTGAVSNIGIVGYAGGIAGKAEAITIADCYWLTGTALVALASGSAETVEMSQQEMQDSDFADTLNANAETYNEDMPEISAGEWIYQAGEYPSVRSNEDNGGRRLSISVSPAGFGTAIAYVLNNDTGEYELIESKALVKAGSTVKIVVNPAAGCSFAGMTIGQTAYQELTDGYVVFTMPDSSTDVAIDFQIEYIHNADPIYVDPEADGNGDGSIGSPYNTLEEAANALEILRGTYPTSNVTVYLKDGTYRLDETLSFNTENTPIGGVTYTNYGAETPVITSAVRISGDSFQKVEDKAYYSHQLEEGEGGYPEFRDLIVNGKRAVLARSDDYQFTRSFANEVINGGSVTECDNLVYVNPDALAGLTGEITNSLELCMDIEWRSILFHIASIGIVENGLAGVTFKSDEWTLFHDNDGNNRSLTGRKYWLQNSLAYLDEPGEFYYDQQTGVIYYYPYSDENMEESVVEYPTLDVLFDIEGVSNLTFDGITFTGTTSNFVTQKGHAAQLGNTYMVGGYNFLSLPCSAIRADVSEKITVQNCVFKELGTTGVLFNHGAKNITITGNSFVNLAMSAIQVGVQQLSWGSGGSENVTISNNYIENIGRDYTSSPAISAARVKNLSVVNNSIKHVPYTGIMVGWGFNPNPPLTDVNVKDAEIAYNDIEDFMYRLNDGAGIYTCGGNAPVANTSLFNSIHDNYIKAIANLGSSTGIYHDGGTSNWHTYSNVIDGVMSNFGAMYFQDSVVAQYTHNITAEDNYSTVSQVVTTAVSDRNIQLLNNKCVRERADLPQVALDIIAAAGLESEYQDIVPEDGTDTKFISATPHLMITPENAAELTVEITNHTEDPAVYSVSVLDALPDNVILVASPESISVQPGETGSITLEFSIQNLENRADGSRIPIGFRVSDAAGRCYNYQKTVSLMVSFASGRRIPYGTPEIDGILDAKYLESIQVDFGSIFYPNANAPSDLEGYAYLLWDENYLYCYAVVNESTVMSHGAEWIEGTWATTQPWQLTPWQNDALEAYISTTRRINGAQVGVDAFGVLCYGDLAKSLYENLPYATRFTSNGNVIENYSIPEPGAGQLASTPQQQVDGYVIEMTLPITDAMGVYGVPSAGDIIQFKIQNNDLQSLTDGTETVVARSTSLTGYMLAGESTPAEPPELNGIIVSGVSNGNKQSTVNFDIVSPNGKGYTVYLSESGQPGTFEEYSNVNYNAQGVHIKKLTNGDTYFVYVKYQNGDTTLVSDIVEIAPAKNYKP